MAAEPVNGAVLHAHRHHPDALAFVHDQVEREILHEELRVVLEGLPVERVQHGVPRAVRRARAAVRLPALAVIERLPAERALVDFAVVGSGKRQAVILQLNHGFRRLAAHVLDRVLVAEPVRALDGVVRVPPPVVFGQVPERGVDPALRGDGVRPSREQLRDARRFQAVLGEPDRGAQARPAGAHNHGIVLVVDDRVRGGAWGE